MKSKTELDMHESLRVQVYNTDNFVDAYVGNIKCLETNFYNVHFHQLRKKEKVFCMFTFSDKNDIETYNFGWFSNAEIVWKSY